ncbi:hypothetical protein E24_00268 [Faustovirus]|nr:hypothetical protein PRJ_Fausto_00253 [Faustovirus]AMN83192.1 hypothetical protein E24_00268 [Faustovirus]AMN84173.1 hypothetical protein D5a_00267 [Faustovirus]AMN85162.1 hypothetical protein E23_00267 [Faustovirus]QBR99161.1 hypothetical protein [Faustovirus mariensis]
MYPLISRCYCCNKPKLQPMALYCSKCIAVFTNYINPIIKQALRSTYDKYGYVIAKDITVNINSWNCSVYLFGKESACWYLLDTLIDLGGFYNETTDDTVINYCHLNISWSHTDAEETYFGEQYSCYFNLDGRADTLYKIALFNQLDNFTADVSRLTPIIMDDLLDLEPLIALRFM